EEKRRLEEEKKRIEEEEKKRQKAQQKQFSENITPEDRGKQAVESEPHPLVLVLQEQLEAQKVEQQKIKEDIKNLSEGQEHVIKNQEDISSKLNAILA
ncbi:hypothetical protein A2U01_0074193, partial [Trifolium medium]|nr:hypothetical protein [Trifolium medium]